MEEDSAGRFVTSDFIYHARGEDVTGIENLKEWVSSDHSVFPDIRFTIVDSIAESSKVATAWFLEATHEKEFRGITATHKKFVTVGMNVFHFEGNKIKAITADTRRTKYEKSPLFLFLCTYVNWFRLIFHNKRDILLITLSAKIQHH